MSKLKEELDRLERNKDKFPLYYLEDTYKSIRANVLLVMQGKQMEGLETTREQNIVKQIDENIKLVQERLNRIF